MIEIRFFTPTEDTYFCEGCSEDNTEKVEKIENLTAKGIANIPMAQITFSTGRKEQYIGVPFCIGEKSKN